jgi:hypothetical protein
VDLLVGLVPEEPGRESSIFVVDGDVPGCDICGVMAAGSSSASTFCKGAPFVVPSEASRDRVAAGVMGGECIEVGRGLWWGDGRPEEVRVLYRLASRELSSCDGTLNIDESARYKGEQKGKTTTGI